MSVVQITTIAVSVIAALSRILDAAKPFWGMFPRPVAAFIPSIVVMLPSLAAALGLVKTPVDLTVALITAAALVVPGAMPKDTARVK